MEPATQFAVENIGVESFVGTSALLIGDVVFLASAGTASKTTTPANYLPMLGVVVGGRSTFGKILQDDLDIGEQACATGEDVLVATRGIVKMLSDAALATIGTLLAPGETTAGRAQAVGAGDFVIGAQLDVAGGAAEVIRVLLQIGRTNAVAA